MMAFLTVVGNLYLPSATHAESCPDLKVIFARGSGGGRWTNEDYLEFKKAIEPKLQTTTLSYEFIDLDYPAVAIGLDHLETSLGALIGSGDAYEFGDSVNAGVAELVKIVNGSACPNTRYVLGGYSQGAMAVSKSLRKLNADKLIYAATFGDPKIYLPEGKGLVPAACSGENLSDYRMYVPDCRAYMGLLGSYIPYETENLTGKVGTWCNKKDIFCSSHLSVSDHLAYMSDALYEDASRVIFDKIADAYRIENNISSPHDTAILIDSTGSMLSMINEYKAEALRLAKETFNSGGRVALYDYRDLADPYAPVEHCNFETCTLEVFESELNKIRVNNGGDTPESLLSAAYHVMKNLNWRYGSTKSLVILTDADFLSPDRDGMDFDTVVKLSKKIDPVNFYIITNSEEAATYAELSAQTGGKVVTNFDELSLLTDYIMERYDSLPRVEESPYGAAAPELQVKSVRWADGEVTVKIDTTGTRTLIVVDDAILGFTDETEFTITGVDESTSVSLVPLSEDTRGATVRIRGLTRSGPGGGLKAESDTISVDNQDANLEDYDSMVVPKVPNTGVGRDAE